jgi:hypothetical protein
LYSTLSTSASHEASIRLVETPTVPQDSLAVGGFDQHAGLGRGGLLGIEDADVVVHQLHMLDGRVEAGQRLAQASFSASTGPSPSPTVSGFHAR